MATKKKTTKRKLSQGERARLADALRSISNGLNDALGSLADATSSIEEMVNDVDELAEQLEAEEEDADG